MNVLSTTVSAATARAIISSGRDGSAASAAASGVQLSAASSVGARRSRASMSVTITSSRCTPARTPLERAHRRTLRACPHARMHTRKLTHA